MCLKLSNHGDFNKVRFDGTPDLTNPNLLAIDTSASSAASGVAINLMTADKVDLPLHGENSYNYVLSSTQDNTLKFYAQYISTTASVTPGTANLLLTSPLYITDFLFRKPDGVDTAPCFRGLK